MQGRRLLLDPRWASGGVDGRRRGTAGAPADGGRMGDASGKSGPALGAGSSGVEHGWNGRRNTRRRKAGSGAPLPGAPNVGFRVPVDPLGSNSGVHAEIAPPTYLCLVASQGSKLHEEQHKRHKIYTGSGHHCGVIPYSSVVWWIASRAEDEQYKGKNSLLRRGVLVLGELGWLRESSIIFFLYSGG